MEDYEKKYKEALSRAATELETCGADKSLRNMIYAIFPDELKESEDERVKKRILLSLEKDLMATKNSGCDTQDLEQCIAWLEKQGDQKPVIDFKAKNWYVSKVDGKIHDMTYNSADKVEPIFSIGDVLCDKSCTTLNKNSQPNIKILDIRNGMYICNNCSFPIEQQDEYELVAKKIEDEIEIPFGAKDSGLQEETYYIPKGFHAEIDDDKVVIKKGEKPAAWSDEDEERIKNTLSVLDVQVCWDGATGKKGNPYQKEIDWLKSIKERIIWKPSKKQMETLEYYMHTLLATEHKEVLFGLYNDLKKL